MPDDAPMTIAPSRLLDALELLGAAVAGAALVGALAIGMGHPTSSVAADQQQWDTAFVAGLDYSARYDLDQEAVTSHMVDLMEAEGFTADPTDGCECLYGPAYPRS